MSIRIVTDSTCDLPPEIIAEYRITVVPLYVNIAGQSFLDGVNLSRPEFYRQLTTFDPPPTTAAPGPDTFRHTYERLATEGATEILSIHLTETLSATYNNARLGAQATTAIPVTTLDSRQISMGLGFVVLAAARAVAAGYSLAETVVRVTRQIPHIHMFAVLDTLEFLKRSGRVSLTAAGLGSLLRIKPLFQMHNGHISIEKVRTTKRSTQRLAGVLSTLTPLDQLAFLHSDALEAISTFHQQVSHLLPVGEVPVVEVSPIIGTHIGPGAIGLACVSQKENKLPDLVIDATLNRL